MGVGDYLKKSIKRRNVLKGIVLIIKYRHVMALHISLASEFEFEILRLNRRFSLLRDANQALILILRVLKSGAADDGRAPCPEITAEQKKRVNHTIMPYI